MVEEVRQFRQYDTHPSVSPGHNSALHGKVSYPLRNSLLKKPGSLGSFTCPWQRSCFATPLRAISICWPQPDQVGFPHFRHVVLLHIIYPFLLLTCRREADRQRQSSMANHFCSFPKATSITTIEKRVAYPWGYATIFPGRAKNDNSDNQH